MLPPTATFHGGETQAAKLGFRKVDWHVLPCRSDEPYIDPNYFSFLFGNSFQLKKFNLDFLFSMVLVYLEHFASKDCLLHQCWRGTFSSGEAVDAELEVGLWFGRILWERYAGRADPVGVLRRILLQPRLRILWKALLHVGSKGVLGKWVHRAAAFFARLTLAATV